MGTERNLRIGLPSKGRLSEIASELLSQAGLSFKLPLALYQLLLLEDELLLFVARLLLLLLVLLLLPLGHGAADDEDVGQVCGAAAGLELVPPLRLVPLPLVVAAAALAAAAPSATSVVVVLVVGRGGEATQQAAAAATGHVLLFYVHSTFFLQCPHYIFIYLRANCP